MVALSVVALSVVALSVVALSVVALSVVAGMACPSSAHDMEMWKRRQIWCGCYGCGWLVLLYCV